MLFKTKHGVMFYILFVTFIFSQAQNYADKNYYLIDSLELNNLVVNEKEMLQSSLTDFHKATTENQKLAAVNTIIEHSWDKNIWSKYNQWMHKYLKEKLGEMTAITISTNINSQEKTLLKYYANSINNNGFLHHEEGSLTKALSYYYESLAIREIINDSLGMSETYNNIGTIYAVQDNISKALEFAEKSIKISELINNTVIGAQLSNLAILYGKQSNKHKEMLYYQKSLEAHKMLKDTVGIAHSQGLIASFYKSEGELDKSLSYLLKKLKVVEKNGHMDDVITTLSNISSIYFEKENTYEAMLYGEKSLKLAEIEGKPELISLVTENLSLIYQKRKNWKKAFRMEVIHVKMKDSLQNNEIENSLIEQAAKYEIDKKQQEIILLSVKNEIQELRINKHKKSILLISLALFSALILAYVAHREYRKKLYINRLLESQKAEISRENEDKKVMLQEIHHRVKNNLQVVNSLLRMQSNKTSDKEVISAFKETQNRVLSMAKLHEKMYQSGNLKRLNAKTHITMLVEEIVKNYTLEKNIGLNLDIVELYIDVQTMMPLSLIINEIITNSLKYAFEGRENGIISVKLTPSTPKTNELYVSDNGIGYTPEKLTVGLGTKLIQSFTKQLNGTIEKTLTNGTAYRLSFENKTIRS